MQNTPPTPRKKLVHHSWTFWFNHREEDIREMILGKVCHTQPRQFPLKILKSLKSREIKKHLEEINRLSVVKSRRDKGKMRDLSRTQNRFFHPKSWPVTTRLSPNLPIPLFMPFSEIRVSKLSLTFCKSSLTLG